MHTRKGFKPCTVTFVVCYVDGPETLEWEIQLIEKDCRKGILPSLSSYYVQGTLHTISPLPLGGRVLLETDKTGEWKFI